jgi:DNA replication protein DnaC
LQKSKGFKSTDDEDAYIAKMNSARLLILDDLGAERGTDYALEIVYNIIDTRYRSGKPMIVTTNLTMNEMQEENNIRLRRIYDRIFEVCFPVEFRGKSLRMKKAAKRYDDMAKLMEDE